MITQAEKASKFYELHRQAGVLLIPNPWDGGSARILESLGFEALATSSSAAAAVLGRRDGKISREESLSNARIISSATNLPVSGDLENGFGDSPDTVIETIQLAAKAGLVGGSIEDSTGDRESPLYEIEHAVDRITAAAETARSLPFRFTLTARAENFTRGRPDLNDVIRRLVAYEKAGADVLFAPALPDLDSVRAVCSAVSKPVNFMAGIKGKSFSVEQLLNAGVKRISFASSLYRTAVTQLLKAATEAKTAGTFNYLNETLVTSDLNKFLAD
jgi:2-methylisocitrate lyase-like PEP mutase family enzyme